ncbi:neutral/alkaline non-lysosomal ceramidase N-terminal domain-containing protein [uncultured Kriegella sp.]|uniref:neutral/alkaline non-lysosomal ceramidase N-terminal domain-containing protein n=1 Tax=uncultured Kriegella sp. TaxID=1798910 RepID=UPI0030DD2799|tara:strand:- start:11237 stop:12643 length:1407 start_codon:yes stop_codon:yes gene_type:complete
MKVKRWQRRLIRVLGAVFLLLMLLLYAATSTIDTTPYFKTSYYENTIQKMDSAIESKIAVDGPFFAGFARTHITPKVVSGVPDPKKGEFNTIKMAGFGDGQIAVGVHDSLFAKAVAVEVDKKELVFVSADMVMIPELVVLEVEKKLKDRISRKQLFFGATHTHASIGNCIPGFVGKSFGGEYQPEVVAWLSEKFTQLILDALHDKRPAKVASGYRHVPHLVRNRIIGETGRLNDKLNLLSIIQDNGTQAAIGIFAAHATTIATWNNQFSGDYPGYFQRNLEQNGVDLALFFAGTVGSHSNKGEGEKFSKAQYIGETLADAAQVLLNEMVYDSTAVLTSVTTELEIPKLQAFYVSDRRRLSAFMGSQLLTEMQSIYLQGTRLNDFIWLAMPYELSGEYGIDLKNALELKGYNSALTSFNGQYLGYIVPQKYYYYDTYEARLMGWYGPSMGDYLMELNFKMANALTNTRL